MIFWLILFGIFTYYIVRWSVASITRTPVWLLWLVMMIPAFVLTGWVEVNGDQEPPLAVFIPFLVCPLVYWYLVQAGRIPGAPPAEVSRPSEGGAEEQALSLSASDRAVSRPTLRPIDKEEEATLQTCFPWSVYYLQNVEYRPQALICRGQLRTSPEVAYKTIQENIESKFGKRFLIVFQEGLNGKPFFALVPNPYLNTANRSPNEAIDRPGLALGLLLVTFFTATMAGVGLSNALQPDTPITPSLIKTGLPYSIALLGILGVHEFGHYFMARFHRIRATLPYFIPFPPLNLLPFGTLGAFIQMRSPVPNRKALFDVGISGPLAGLVVSIPVFLWGLAHSEVVSASEQSSILNFSSFTPNLLLTSILSRMALPEALSVNQAIDLHPVAIAGYLGILLTALNLMPVGQLDGGHIVHAMFGQRTGATIGQVSRFLLLFMALLMRPELLLGAVLLFFIPVIDEPALNDVSELDNRRDLLGLVALALLLVIILPAPPQLLRLLFPA